MIEKCRREAKPLVTGGAPGRDRTCDHRIGRVTDHAHWAFYLRLCLQSITLEMLWLP